MCVNLDSSRVSFLRLELKYLDPFLLLDEFEGEPCHFTLACFVTRILYSKMKTKILSIILLYHACIQIFMELILDGHNTTIASLFYIRY